MRNRYKTCKTSLFCRNHIIDGFAGDKEPGHINSTLGAECEQSAHAWHAFALPLLSTSLSLALFLLLFSLSFSFHSFLKLHDFPDLQLLWHGAEGAKVD